MADPLFSPDGKWMWSGTEWIPAPPGQSGQQLNMQDSVIGGDVVHNTVVNNDPAAVTTAVIAALQQMGMVNPTPATPAAPPPTPEVALPAAFNVGDHVEYHSPTNARWLDRCKVVGINDDGTYRIEVPYPNSILQTKHAVVIGSAPGTIRPASPPFKAGDRVLVDWKRYGHYYPGRIAAEHDDHTFLIHFDDGDVEDNVEWIRIEPLNEESAEVQAYVENVMNEEQELIDAFRVFDTNNTGTISAREYLRILSELGDNPLPVEDVLREFADLGIELDSEIDYRSLAKFMVASEQEDISQPTKPEVVIHDASIEGDTLSGYAYDHPKLGEGRINSSAVVGVTYDERATARVETQNTVYVVGPTGWRETPASHPFNDAEGAFYTVEGAGTVKCNGTYLPSTEFDGVPSYINGDVLLLRWKMGNGDQWWYLANRNSLDTKRGDYYRVRSSSDTPPSTGWTSDDQTEGAAPYPSVVHTGNPPSTNPYSVGQQVNIEWNGQWFAGQILEVKDDAYFITYHNYGAEWDEWVDASRLQST
ncbi:MAG: Tudor-knot domain-containing protein [Candidatus Thermoplasmatota archaeon]|nr:Tudor-knot domain-containing protein [Candidatus Thermoplasmatota archaeon]